MTDKPDPLLGRRIGHCALQRKLGQGGMGAVYLAHHAGLNKPVALKILPEALAKNPDYIARFLREARLAARLEHPNVVQVFDVGQSEELYYISMQYVEGRSLDALLKERGRVSPNEALSVAKRVAAALEAARRLGITHRDIKPANILVSKDGIVKVADFGLAKELESNAGATEPGQILGTPHYMAPEQAQGKAVDHRTDIYSLGATLYHLLTGRKPFEGPTPLSVVVKAIKDEPVPPREIEPSIPEAVDRLVRRLMAKNPDARPATCDEVMKLIDAIKGGGPATAIVPPKRRAAMVALPVAGILIVGVVLGMALARTKPEPPPPPPPKPVVKVVEATLPPPPPPPPKVEEPPPPPSRRQTILESMKDAQERRLAEEAMDRTEALLTALKARDVKAIRDMTDRLTFGDPGEALAGEVARRILQGEMELRGWEFEEVEVRTRMLGRPPQARVTMAYDLRNSGGATKVQAPLHWVKRLDGGWFLTRAPRAENK